MKSLQVSAFSLPDTVGGTQVMVGAIARTLVAQGHEVAVFRFSPDGSVGHGAVGRRTFEGAELISVGNDFSDCDSFEKLYRNETIDALFEQELLRFRPDVVHVHHLTCLSTGMLDVLRRHRVPTMMTLWDFWLGCPRGQRMQDDLTLCRSIDRATCAPCCRRLWPNFFSGGPGDLETMRRYDEWIRRVIEEVDVLATPSRDTRDEYRAFGITRDDVEVVPCGLDHERFQVPRAPAGDRLRVGYIGSVIPSKGAHVLVEAFQQLEPEGVRLDVHGEASPWHGIKDYGERLRRLDKGTHEIHLHGRYEPDAVPRILADIDVLVVPGLWYETFCLTIREGFLAGVPVVASRLGAMAEGVEHEVTGLLVEPDDADDLARALRRLRDDPALRQRLAAADKGVATTEAMVRRFAELYDHTMSLHGKTGGFA